MLCTYRRHRCDPRPSSCQSTESTRFACRLQPSKLYLSGLVQTWACFSQFEGPECTDASVRIAKPNVAPAKDRSPELWSKYPAWPCIFIPVIDASCSLDGTGNRSQFESMRSMIGCSNFVWLDQELVVLLSICPQTHTASPYQKMLRCGPLTVAVVFPKLDSVSESPRPTMPGT